ncbi:MAG TPA: lysine 5,6-aminomutase subunit alpha [Candidatus Limnocylindrales bacterium]|nr:lysine 5,6-aminomutase subunit alpha [Candidatus Limnocylindrales bacterium]
MTTDLGPLDRLADRAETLAGAWAGRARASTTVGRERAMLRMFGVSGLDAAGRPLAWSVVDRYLGGGPGRLGGGIVLPFAIALAEYDLDPQRLALDVASGAVDLGLEGALLREPDRRAIAEEEASRLVAAAVERIDANRTARSELIALLGEPGRPWIAAAISGLDLGEALDEARIAVEAGADLLQIEVPIGRELTDHLRRAGRDVPDWRPRAGIASPDPDLLELAPSGSQRALGSLRRDLDEAAAERRGYVRLGIVPPPLGIPESAIVAGFERIDMAVSDPLAEIIDGHVAPDRALADHAFGQALLARAGVVAVLGAGPLVVGPDIARGMPSSPASRAGRALALQLVAVAIARGNGLPDDQIVVGGLTSWLAGETDPVAFATAEIALRRALLPSIGLVLEEPRAEGRATGDLWPALAAAVQPHQGTAAILRRVPSAADIRSTRIAASVAAALAASTESRVLVGVALEHARATAAAALQTLDRLADDGWRAVIGDEPPDAADLRLGADAVAERSDPFDPFGEELSRVGLLG